MPAIRQSRAAVRGNSRPAGRRISSCSSCGRLRGRRCQEKGWAVISPCFSIPLPFSLFTSTFPAETLIFFLHPFAHPMSWFLWVLTLELSFYQHFGIVQLQSCIRMYTNINLFSISTSDSTLLLAGLKAVVCMVTLFTFPGL